MIKIQGDVIDINALINSVRNAESGAIVTFLGTVRAHDESSDMEIKALKYDAYNDMAMHKIDGIIEEARKIYNIIDVSVIQRTGLIKLGEDSIGIAVSSIHRKEAFKACEYIIDKIKIIPPIWKKEVYSDSEVWKSET